MAILADFNCKGFWVPLLEIFFNISYNSQRGPLDYIMIAPSVYMLCSISARQNTSVFVRLLILVVVVFLRLQNDCSMWKNQGGNVKRLVFPAFPRGKKHINVTKPASFSCHKQAKQATAASGQPGQPKLPAGDSVAM